MENILTFSKISKISDIFDFFDIFDIFDISSICTYIGKITGIRNFLANNIVMYTFETNKYGTLVLIESLDVFLFKRSLIQWPNAKTVKNH